MIPGHILGFLYAKICGYSRRAYTGANALALVDSGGLRALYEQVLGAPPPGELTASGVLRRLENEVREEYGRSAGFLASHLDGKVPLLEAMLTKVEHDTLKRLIASLKSGGPPPAYLLEGGAKPFKIERWPDLAAMTAGTGYERIAELHAADEVGALVEIDKAYWRGLWAAASGARGGLSEGVAELVATELELCNAVWALRLYRYYGYTRERAEPLLADLPGRDVRRSALDAFDRSLDERPAWDGWRWSRLVKGETAKGFWKFDVRDFEARASRYVLDRARKAMHFGPFTLLPCYYYLKLRESEMNAVMSVAEGMRMELPRADIVSWLGANA